MKLPSDASATLLSVLTARGVRLTRPRRAVVHVVTRLQRPVSVAEIHERLSGRDVNLGSVYRTIALFCRLDVMRLAASSRGTQRFELSERFIGHHHHLVCRTCGDVQDLDGCVLRKPVLARLEQQIRRTTQFQVMDHDLRLYGVCARCGPAGAS
jgi:Fur family transcriptional regulator, ferric uptake regulator